MPNHKIMIVEDEEIVAADIQTSIEQMGYAVCAMASSGLEAISKAESARPDLILMDIVLKGSMDGIEAALQINELYKIPVVYLTAFGEDGMVQQAKVAEPYGYVTKPFSQRELHIAIEIALYKKQAEARLQKMELWLATVLKSIGDAVIASDKERRITFMNAVAENLTGWKQRDALGKNLTEVLNIKDRDLRDLEKHLVEKVITEGLIINLIEDHLLIAKDGTEIPISDSAAPIKDDSGETAGSVLIFRDITEHIQSEKKLRQAEVNFRRSLDDSPMGVRIVNAEGKTIYTNHAILDIYGYDSIDELEATPVINRYTPESYAEHQIRRGKRKRDEYTSSEYEISIVRKDGEVRHLQVFRKEVLWDGEKQFQVIYQDITERKRAEEDRAVMENQLFQTQKMDAIGILAGGIAHDFNNILAAIIGYTEMAMDESQKEIRQRYLQETLNGSERARNLIRQILAFSRQDSHEKKPLDIKLLLTEAVTFLRASIPATIEIRQLLTDDSCNILADPNQVHQIIMNLCTNATHAMKQAGGKLTLEVSVVELSKAEIPHHPDLKPGHYVKLTVSDTGHGIDPANIQRIFDPFFTTKPKDEGTGLGLSVVYGIVKSHGGVITLYSEPEKGANFHVYLPMILHKEVANANVPARTISGGTERILFVDDEPSLVDIGTNMLSALGYKVTGVTGSMEALDLFRAEPKRFDLVITDMTLPKMTGIDLSRAILQIRPDIPIILCSGIREADTEAQVKSLGIKAYCTKPLTKRDLAKVIRDSMNSMEE